MSSSLVGITYDDCKAVNPSDTVNDASGPFAGLLVTAPGTLTFQSRAGTKVVLEAVVVGQVVTVPCIRVFATGTSATVHGLIGAPYYRAMSGS
jgi:hypothetical protein